MDSATLGQYSGYIAIIISMASLVIGVINRKRIRSTCCGRTASASLNISDISSITPPTPSQPRPTVAV